MTTVHETQDEIAARGRAAVEGWQPPSDAACEASRIEWENRGGSPFPLRPSAEDDAEADGPEPDPINPPHYRAHPSGVECITITQHMTFCLGNVVKYLWRAGLKTAVPLEDLRKAAWYLNAEIVRLEAEQDSAPPTL